MRSLSLFLVVAGAAGAAASCTRDDGKKLKVAPSSINVITACPKGAMLDGAPPSESAPPPPPGGADFRQRCQKDESTRHGASREWYADGRERTYSEWWEGEKHGRFTFWFKNGQLRAEGSHRFGVPAGKWTYRGEDGQILQQETFPVAPPDLDWVAQAIAGKEPVRDMPPTDTSTEGSGVGANSISSPVNDDLPAKADGKAADGKVIDRKITAPDKAAPAPAYTPAPVDPVFSRGAQSN